ncbi:hypothetical protein [Candidatus Odyssella thessalonicensis]|uniref:hypothetical protein n=1 Tax=Candidatus Odyssella thessalonicensis TaxID=84647 RepID=UPI000225A8A1|nr:hypothetical protein [Candidatus Odyssella thessalonicensis]
MREKFYFLMLFVAHNLQTMDFQASENIPLNLTNEVATCNLTDLQKALTNFKEIDSERYAVFSVILEPIIQHSFDALMKESDYNLLINNLHQAEATLPEGRSQLIIKAVNHSEAGRCIRRISWDSLNHISVSTNFNKYIIQPACPSDSAIKAKLIVERLSQ